jgi:LacI family transcriptional regulator
MNKEMTVFDIAILGFNNGRINTNVEPQLTTVNYPGKAMGKVAIRYLSNRLQDLGDLATNSTSVQVTAYNQRISQRKGSL